MQRKTTFTILLLCIFSLSCFAGGLKGNIIDDDTLAYIVLSLILVHILCVIAYFGRYDWLRLICAVLYLPIFLIPTVLTYFAPVLCLSFLPPLAFYYFLIIKKRK